MNEKKREVLLGLAITIAAFLAMTIAIQLGLEG
jgi:hypothetical protein